MDALLQTERLLLRPHRPEDAPFMVTLNADPAVTRYTGDAPFSGPAAAMPVIAALRAEWDAHRTGRLVVVERSTGAPVGFCGLKMEPEGGCADLGYRFLQSRWGRGYATEAGGACVRYGFEVLGLARLVARVIPENTGSVRVLQKLGFQRVGPTRCAGEAADLYQRSRGGKFITV